MGFVRKALGPKSKYDKSIPYLYEARVPMPFADDLYVSYMGDTICAVLKRLQENNISPSDVYVLEIYQDHEARLDKTHLVDENGRWLMKPALCKALKEHYSGHVFDNTCSFEDRNKEGYGPY